MTSTSINILDFDNQSLRDYLQSIGEKPYRATQLIKWLHQCGITDYMRMTDLPVSFRKYLQENTSLILPIIANEQMSRDGTRKFLFKLQDGNHIETVFIPEQNRGTLCISSQVGCPLNCGFCATATLGFTRNLTVSEIIGQLWQVTKALSNNSFARERKITNVVMMGMGEPLLNLDNVIKAVHLMMDDNAYGLSKYRVTISTAGITPQLEKLHAMSSCALAVSLHAPNDELRDKLMPINKKYPLQPLMEACKEYFADEPRRSITFEYVLLEDVNDSIKHAKQLIKLLAEIRCKINLIPFNESPGCKYHRSPQQTMEHFRDVLLTAGINTITRKTRGDDIFAACGQLAAQKSTTNE